jgi:hypothetical protein
MCIVRRRLYDVVGRATKASRTIVKTAIKHVCGKEKNQGDKVAAYQHAKGHRPNVSQLYLQQARLQKT